MDNAVFCKNTFHWFESNIFILIIRLRFSSV
nr:MAG TPA: hypothetical protein [Caudoviricetes sp.]